MEDYEKKYELGSVITAKRTYNGETITGEFDGFHLPDKSNPKSIVGIVHTNNGSYDVEPNSIETVINEDEKISKELISYLSDIIDNICSEEDISHDAKILGGKIRHWIAWLEKQKDHEDELERAYKCADEVQYRKGYEAAKREFEKQGVQKNTCQLNNTYGNVKFPFRARVKSSDAIITIQAGQLSMDCKEWIGYQSDVEDGYRLYKPDELELVYDVEQNQVNTVETKFKVGDWILIDNPCKIISIDNYGNYLVRYWDFDTTDKLHTLSKEFCETYFHLWTIQDAKDGDVLTWDDSKCIALFKEIYNKHSFKSHGCIGACTDVFENWGFHDIENAHPSTKEQRDLLFTKMKEAGYEWDDENKELKKIEQILPTWSVEDEKTFNTVIEKGDLKLSEIDWLKSLKERVQPKQSIGRIFINKHF